MIGDQLAWHRKLMSSSGEARKASYAPARCRVRAQSLISYFVLTRDRVRSVNIEFGFSFGLGAVAPSDSVTAEEPPVKRRKTVDQRHDDVTNRRGVEEYPNTTKKARRRKLADIEDDLLRSAAGSGGDDSFIKMAKTQSRKGRVKAAMVVEASMADTKSAVVGVRGRPRRQAAASAANKVTEGFSEEAVAVDKKRRQVEASVAVQDTEKRGRVESDPSEADIAAANRHPSITQRDQSEGPVAKQMSDEEAYKSQTATLPKRKTTKTSRPQQKKRQEAKAKPQTKESAVPQEGFCSEVQGKSATGPRDSAVAPARPPLIETSCNVPRTTVSPEKPKATKRVPISRTRKTVKLEVSTRDLHEIAEKGSPESNKRRKVHNEPEQHFNPQDNVVHGPSDIPMPSDRQDPSSAGAAILQTIRSAVNHDSSVPSRDPGGTSDCMKNKDSTANPSAKTIKADARDAVAIAARPRNASKPKSRRKANLAPATRTSGRHDQYITGVFQTNEDDVDWLFAPEEKLRAPVSHVNTQRARKMFHTAPKSRDIDLDDLISNIAAFAQPATSAAGMFHHRADATSPRVTTSRKSKRR